MRLCFISRYCSSYVSWIVHPHHHDEGSGHDSRTTEIFIVMPGTPQEQLDYFGENSWETPFGIVVGDAEHRVLTEIYSGYGDMSSMGGKGEISRCFAENFPVRLERFFF
jgi:hypothetical protein